MKKSLRPSKYHFPALLTTLYGQLLGLLLYTISIATPLYSQTDLNMRISLEKNNVSIKDVLKEIEEKWNLKFAYSASKVDLSTKINVNVKNLPLEKVLTQIFQPNAMTYTVKGDRIIISKRENLRTNGGDFANPQAKAFEIPIKGKILDEHGSGFPGAIILVKGTTIGTQTDVNGDFTLQVPDENASLIVSYVGYLSQEIKLGGKLEIEIKLVPEINSLDELVVVGYGSVQKVNLTGAISTIKFDDKVNNRPLTNSSQALGGTASGVWVSQNSGKPGADGAQIRIRGWGTLNNSNPLIIVDGVEGTFDQLNPADIESVSVLKDAASAAIYGSKAANGVVLITTKTGKNNEKMQVSFNTYIGVQTLGKHYNTISNSTESMTLTNTALINGGASPLYSTDLINAFQNGTDVYKYPNTDWFKELFRTAMINQTNLSIRGGSANTSTFLSFNHLKQDGIVPNTSSKRYGIRANVDSKINDFLNVGGRISYINRLSKEPYSDINYGSLGRVFEMLAGATPFIAPYTNDGRFGSVQAYDAQNSLLYDNRNPLIDASNGETANQENILALNANADVNFTKYLSWKTTFAVNGNWSMIDRFNTTVLGYTDFGLATITKNYNREGLEINRGVTNSFSTNIFSTLNYVRAFGQHDFSLLVGTQNERSAIQTVYARRNNPPKEGLTQVDAGTSGIQGTGNQLKLGIHSFFGRVNYALAGKYLFEANFRSDGSSRFKEGNRWGFFPGFSAGWRISDEAFLKDSDKISNLKLRASWGKLGNQNIIDYWPYLTVINQRNDLSYNYGGSFAPGAAITSLVNENITWESSSTFDFGIELGLLNDKVTIEADYFNKRTTDILVQLPVPMTLGVTVGPFENKGEMTNEGLELILNYSNQRNLPEELGFNLGLNGTFIRNNVTRFGDTRSPDQLYLIRQGYSFNELYGYKAIGVYQTDIEAKEHMRANGFVPKAGNLKFEDVNRDGRLDFNDKQSMGNTIPKVTFGVSPSLKYQNFDLNILMQGILGVNVYNQNNFTNLAFENQVYQKRWLNAWSPENTGSDLPMLRLDNSWDNQESTFWVNKLNYIKLKNIQLGYKVPKLISSKYGMSSTYFFVNAQNLFTIVGKNYDGYDPERNTFSSSTNIYPTPRIVTIGLNINF